MESPEPKLEHLFDMHVDLEAPQVVGATPQGMRQIFVVKGGTVEGPRVNGKMMLGGEIVALCDVFEPRLLQAEDVPLSEYYFYVNPMFQTGAPQYAWLNKLIAIGRGKVVSGGVEYRIWAVTQ